VSGSEPFVNEPITLGKRTVPFRPGFIHMRLLLRWLCGPFRGNAEGLAEPFQIG
jgi:hypothetical protein